MCTAKDFDRALVNPASVFDRPEDIVTSDAMTTEQKLEVLKRWEVDALNLSVATEENMAGGEPSRLEEVRSAIDVLAEAADAETAEAVPTTH